MRIKIINWFLSFFIKKKNKILVSDIIDPDCIKIFEKLNKELTIAIYLMEKLNKVNNESTNTKL